MKILSHTTVPPSSNLSAMMSQWRVAHSSWSDKGKEKKGKKEALPEPFNDRQTGKRLSEGGTFIIVIVVASAAPNDAHTTVLSSSDATPPARPPPAVNFLPPCQNLPWDLIY